MLLLYCCLIDGVENFTKKYLKYTNYLEVVKNYKIGGEFDINPTCINIDYSKSDEFGLLFASGRVALQWILQSLPDNKTKTIYIPYYICSSVIKACENAGFKVCFYEFDEHFVFSTENLNIEYNSAILLVNYFGFLELNDLVEDIKSIRPDVTIICDHVQSVWACKGSVADFSFTSLRKHIAVPDGALVYSKGLICKPPIGIEENCFYKDKLIGGLLKSIGASDAIFLNFFENGEHILDETTLIYKASKFSHIVYRQTDWDNIRQKRQENYKYVYELGLKHNLEFVFPFNQKIVPMCVPIVLNNRDEIRNRLKQIGIYLPVHWPINQLNSISEPAKYFAQKELSLIIDQRYSLDEVEYQIKAISNLIK